MKLNDYWFIDWFVKGVIESFDLLQGHVNEKSKIVLVEFNTGLMYPAIEYLKNKVIPLYSGGISLPLDAV